MAEHERPVLEGPWRSQTLSPALGNFMEVYCYPTEKCMVMERQTGKSSLRDGKANGSSICWEVSPSTWFGQQKTGSQGGLHQNSYSMATKTWPLKRHWKGLGKQAHPCSISISSASWWKTAWNCFYWTLLPSRSKL